MNILECTNWGVPYDGKLFLKNVDFHVEEGEIIIVMGPNGAGKSTLLKSLFGLIPHSQGQLKLQGKQLNPRPDRMVKEGFSFVPQGNTIYTNMTIEENLLMGAYLEDGDFERDDRLEEIYEFFPVLKRKRFDSACAMSGGERQILALARALMIRPKLLMLDEPSIGLAPKIVAEVFEKIRHINEHFGTATIIVEHNLKSLLKIAHRGYILVAGEVAVEGPIDEVAKSDVLERAFFGELS